MFNPTFVGRMVADPVLRSTNLPDAQGKMVATPVLNFRVAVDDGFKKDKDGNKVGTEFYECAVWRGAAETIAKYGAKGRVIAIAGTVHTREWYDQKTGEKRFGLTVPNVTGFELFGPSPAAQKETEAEIAPVNASATESSEATPWD